MSDKIEVMQILFEKCDLLYYGQTISHELILSNLTRFLSETAETDEHNVGIILHTGSELFEVIAVVYAALTDILSNETSGQDVVETLKPGDMVIFGDKKKERYRFEGIKTETNWKTKEVTKLAVLKQPGKSDRNATYVMEPYYALSRHVRDV